jgi:regulator of replication initiation timing
MDGKAATETGHKQAMSVSQLVDLVCELKGTVGELRQSVSDLKQTVRTPQQTIDELQVENSRLRQQLKDRDGQHSTQRLDEEYSLEAEDKRSGGPRRKKQKSSRRGRRTTAEKLVEADRHEDVFPKDTIVVRAALTFLRKSDVCGITCRLSRLESIGTKGKSAMSDYMSKSLKELAKDMIADGVIDADEVSQLRKRLYDDGVIDREEADFLFQLNDGTSGNENHPSWQALFVEAITTHVLEDETTPGVLDDDEAVWLIKHMEADGQIDANEQALVDNIKAKATSVCDSFSTKFD